jgi:quercetin dioxygenase-like cupin family protein
MEADMQDGVAYATLDLDGTERFQRLRDVLGVSSFGINLITLQPGQRGRIHRHAKQEEVYLVLEGRLSLAIEGKERDLERGELVRVAPAVRRQLVNRGPGRNGRSAAAGHAAAGGPAAARKAVLGRMGLDRVRGSITRLESIKAAR